MHVRPLFAALLGALSVPAREELTLTRTFALEYELATTHFQLTGSENGRSEEHQAPAVRRAESELVEARDLCADAEDPLARFERRYETVSSSFAYQGGGQEPSEELVNAGLEGKTITFERADEGEWTRTTDAEGVNPRQLERLRADLSLGEFLPDEELAVGASWELGYAPFERLVGPLGPVGARARRRTMGGSSAGLELAPSCLVEPLWLLLAKAEGSATFTRVEAEEGAELAALAEIEFRFEATHDGSKHLLRGREGEVEDEVTITWSGTGTLAWERTSGALEIKLDGELDLEEEFAVAFEGNGVQGELKGSLACSGPFDAEAREAREE